MLAAAPAARDLDDPATAHALTRQEIESMDNPSWPLSLLSDVSVSQDVRLNFQVVQPTLDYVPNANNAGQLAVAQDRHMSHAMARHQLHHVIEIIVRCHGHQRLWHDIFDRHGCNGLGVTRKSVDNIAFGNETEDHLTARDHKGSDVF
jgi:hypothetical protein